MSYSGVQYGARGVDLWPIRPTVSANSADTSHQTKVKQLIYWIKRKLAFKANFTNIEIFKCNNRMTLRV